MFRASDKLTVPAVLTLGAGELPVPIDVDWLNAPEAMLMPEVGTRPRDPRWQTSP